MTRTFEDGIDMDFAIKTFTDTTREVADPGFKTLQRRPENITKLNFFRLNRAKDTAERLQTCERPMESGARGVFGPVREYR
jgi:hypothetical protein